MIKKDLRKNIVIHSKDNINLLGLLQIPITPKNPPLVICFHDLGSHKYGFHHYLVHLSKLLVKVGIASLRVDFRGSGDSDGKLSESVLDLLEDALNIIQNPLNLSEINIEKIGLFESSLGGSLALLSLKTYSKALALWTLIVSGKKWSNDFLNNTKNKKEELYSHEVSLNFQEQFLNMDLSSNIKNLPSHLKILHMHEVLDGIVSINHQKAFIQSIDKNKSSLTIKSYENASHSLGAFSKKSNVLNEIVTWFTNQLKIS